MFINIYMFSLSCNSRNYWFLDNMEIDEAKVGRRNCHENRIGNWSFDGIDSDTTACSTIPRNLNIETGLITRINKNIYQDVFDRQQGERKLFKDRLWGQLRIEGRRPRRLSSMRWADQIRAIIGYTFLEVY